MTMPEVRKLPKSLWWIAAVASAISILALVTSTTRATAGSAVIGGMKMSCSTANAVVSAAVPGPGFAAPRLIMFGPKFLRSYPPLVQRLIFLHECGHQHVGTDENAADCWAVRQASGKVG